MKLQMIYVSSSFYGAISFNIKVNVDIFVYRQICPFVFIFIYLVMVLDTNKGKVWGLEDIYKGFFLLSSTYDIGMNETTVCWLNLLQTVTL